MADKRKGNRKWEYLGLAPKAVVPELQAELRTSQRWPRKWDTPPTAFSWVDYICMAPLTVKG